MPAPFDPLLFFGHLHPMLVHLPIGCLAVLAVIELAGRVRRFSGATQARELALVVTALSAIASITCGLMLSSDSGYDPELLFWHKWLGLTMGGTVLAATVALWMKRTRWYAAFLAATLALLLPVGHFGGSMTHGRDYLLAYAPLWMRPAPAEPLSSQPHRDTLNDPAQADLYEDLARPVLAAHCLACHGATKTGGGLRLDSVAAMLKGGNNGPAITGHEASKSQIIRRMLLPLEDPKHMPPEGKPQPNPEQIEVVQWWIDSGASEHGRIAGLSASASQLQLAAGLLNLPAPGSTKAAPPVALENLAASIARITAATKIVITPVAADQPWIIVNAAVSPSFGDAQLEQFTDLASNIVDLNLAGTHVSDAGLHVVATMGNLRRLRLERTAVTDAGLAHLSSLAKLEYLNLYGTNVTDASLEHLAAIPALRRLYVWKTSISPAAAEAFAARKADPTRIARLQAQIDQLKSQIDAQRLEVFSGTRPSSQPTTAPQPRH